MSDDPRYLELRAEWLKLRGYLYDPSTGLPALPAVIEDVRRRIESGDRVGLIYLDLHSEERLEEVYGWETYDGLLRQMAEALVGLRAELLKPDDLITLSGVRSDEFLVFVGSRVLEGQDFHRLQRSRDRLVSALSEKLRIQVDSERPRGLGIHSSAVLVRCEPTVRVERAIYKAVDEARALCRREREQKHTLRLNELRRILAAESIRVRYQPILRLDDGQVHGFEALSAGPQGDIFENPEMLFSFAEETDQIVDLERLCRTASIRGAASVGPERRLFLNTSARGVLDPEFLSPDLLEQARLVGLAPENLVVEITERVAITSNRDFRRAVDRLRETGVRFAIDDVGAGYSSLQTVAEIEPNYLKFDLSLVRDIHQSRIKRNLLESLVSLADKIEAEVIAEGVEQVEEYRTLRALDVPYGQGYLFGPPTPMPRFDAHLPAA